MTKWTNEKQILDTEATVLADSNFSGGGGQGSESE